MGCKNTQVWNWQCWGDPTDQGNAAAGLCFFHFIQCLSEWSWILHRSPASGKMFPLSPAYVNSGPVSPGTWRGSSVSPGGSVWDWPHLNRLGGRRWTCAPSNSGVLERAWKNSREGEQPSAGPGWGELCLPGVCAAGEEEAQAHSQYSWKIAQVTCVETWCLSGVLKFCIKNQ